MVDADDTLLPLDALEPAWRKEYAKLIDVVWGEIVKINTSLFILERIVRFSWAVFVAPTTRLHLWSATADALFGSVVMGVWRLCVDSSGDGISIRQMKNRIREHLLPPYPEKFFALLRESEFERESADIEAHITEIRHNYFAHLKAEKLLAPTPEDVAGRAIDIRDLREYAGRLNRFFKALCFGSCRAVLPLGYHPGVTHPVTDDPRPDIDRILDAVADASHVMVAYRAGGAEWDMVANAIGPSGVTVVETYARRLDEFRRFKTTGD